jgi:hypothetical protein
MWLSFAQSTRNGAMLQGERDHRCEGIHQSRDRRTLLGHGDEDFAW